MFIYIHTYIIYGKNIDYINGAIQYLHKNKTKEITEVIVTKPTKQAIRAAKSQLGKSEKATTKPSREAGQPDPKRPDRLVSGRYGKEREGQSILQSCRANNLLYDE